MLKRTIIIGVVMVMLTTGSLLAQVARPGLPKSLSARLGTSLSAVTTPPVDRLALLAEDALSDTKDEPMRFGVPFEVDYTLDNAGSWETLADGTRVWRLRVESPGASSINLVYNRFELPAGASLYIYNEDGSHVLGAFTEANNKEHGQFATAPIPGEVCILEYNEPASVDRPGIIDIGRIVHGYRDVFAMATDKAGGFGESGACNNNVNCPEGLPWSDEIRSVAMILTGGGWRLCTGALINNARLDRKPYFLTANHCLGGEETWIFMFNYESPDCTNTDGPTWMTTSGAVLWATNEYSDFALIEMLENPPDSYNVYYSGWSALADAADSSVAIHHPSGDIKKISFDYDPLTSTAYEGGAGSGESHWRVGQWDDGTTEAGSSGSPLFDYYHRIVGQLEGGFAACENSASDWYGKFSNSWSYGGTPATRLREWLDPDSTGIMTLDGRDATGLTAYVVPLPDTRETQADYEVTVYIASDCALETDSLLLWYEAWDTVHVDTMSATGTANQYHGFISAQPPGTDVYYWASAWDMCGQTDTTDVFSFRVLDNGVMITPIYAGLSARVDSIVECTLTVTNTGINTNNYDLTVSGNTWPSSLWMTSGLFEAEQTGDLDSAEIYTFLLRVEVPASYYGDYDSVEVTATAQLHDSVTASALVWTVSEGAPTTLPFFDDFADIDINRSFWTIHSTLDITSDGLAEPTEPYSVNLDGDPYGTDTLTMQVIDLTSEPEVMLSYYYEAGGGGEVPDNGDGLIVEYLSEAGGWQHLARHDGNGVAMTVFAEARWLIPTDGHHSSFQARFRTEGDSGPFDDWFVDDVRVDYAPIMNVAPGSITDTVPPAGTAVSLQTITNSGLADLTWHIDTMPPWISIDDSSGLLAYGETDTLTFTLSAATLDSGLYLNTVAIASNDPRGSTGPYQVPVLFRVTPYLCGDINDDGKINLADISRLISYVYLEGTPPVYIESGNVNGSTDDKINLADISLLISFVYLDGGPLRCR